MTLVPVGPGLQMAAVCPGLVPHCPCMNEDMATSLSMCGQASKLQSMFPNPPHLISYDECQKTDGFQCLWFLETGDEGTHTIKVCLQTGKKKHYTCSEEYGLFRWAPQRTVNTTAPQKWKVTPLCHFESGHSSSLKFSSKIIQVNLISIKILMTSRQNGSSGKGACIQTLEPKSDHRKSRDGRTNPTTTSHSLTRCTLWHSLYTVTKWIR